MSFSTRNTPLDAFLYDLCNVVSLNHTSFYDLYPWYFDDITTTLKKEIVSNLTSLSEAQFGVYINFVKAEIKRAYVYDPDICIIEKWLKKFNLKESDFPFFLNDDIKSFLSNDPVDTNLDIENKKLSRIIQLEFHWYAVFLEVSKMIKFIDDLLKGHEIKVFKNDKVLSINPYPKIFKDLKAYNLFSKLMDEFGNTPINLSNYSFIFHKMVYEDLIHSDLKQQSYYNFLSEFDISISRIKPLANIGKIEFRESIYLNSKMNTE